jgi:hypothetical protein
VSGATARHRAVTLCVLAAVLVGTAASTSGAPAAHPDPVVRDLDLAASANPSAAEPVVADNAFSADAVSRRRTVKSDVTATGSAICDGCDAASTALQVLYVGRVQEAHFDNTAAAWTQSCTDCTATALSVQVVVLRGAPAIVPNNRALAVNAACTSCQATGVAFQVVVSAGYDDRLSGESLAALRAWVAKQAEELRTPATTTETPGPVSRLDRTKAHRRAQRAADSALVDLEELVSGDLEATTVSSDVELGH